MKKLILLAVLLIGYIGQSQIYIGYAINGKKTSAQIAAIDVSNTSYIYTAYDTDLGYEVINSGAGWGARYIASGVTLSGNNTFTGTNTFQQSTTFDVRNDAVNNNMTWKGNVASGFTRLYVDYNGNGSGFSNLDIYSNDIKFNNVSLLSSGLANIVEDISPQLGGTLDALKNNIIDVNTFEIENSLSTQIMRQNVSGDYYDLQPLLNAVPGSTLQYSFSADKWQFLGAVQMFAIQGGGNQMVTVDNNGNIGAQAIPSDNSLSQTNQVIVNGTTRAIDVQPTGKLEITVGAQKVIVVDGLNSGVVEFPLGIDFNNTLSGLTANKYKEAIDEVQGNVGANGTSISANASSITDNSNSITTLNAVSASQFGFKILAVNQTAIANDALDSLIVKLNYDNESFTIPSGVFSVGQSIRISRHKEALNEVRIIQGSGVDIFGVTDGYLLGAYPSATTITRTSSATGPEQWEIEDYFDKTNIVDWTSCTADPNELFTTANAASDPNCNETNGFAGVSEGLPTANVTVTADSGTKNVGDYSLKIYADASSSSFMEISISVESGKTYTFTGDFIQTIGTTAIVHTTAGGSLVTGEPSFSAISEGTWGSKTFTIVCTSTGTLDIGVYAANSGTIGDTVFADNISIIWATT